ncbi:rRNA maturation RNase YbeY [Legionella israelensis]|uniref:Endoribonuclease YbeY n=1 Tax=Legionella israelensis TaxID=454 RepID=A0AAX1EGD4_9GAMM|nr:rRNA maturation RNase YbeY [Legionella israelensis]QBR84221.1 rRNA maturation RNase YbeY [Legionella israelensis]
MTNSYHIDIQKATEKNPPISENNLTRWAKLALRDHIKIAELTIRLVDKEEITTLNRTYRKKDKATNVLAFPADVPKNIELDYPLLGDVIICPQVLEEESQKLDTSLIQHWAHIVIHGILHLLGYDHMIETDAVKMQSIEVRLLNELGYNNPYENENDNHE